MQGQDKSVDLQMRKTKRLHGGTIRFLLVVEAGGQG